MDFLAILALVGKGVSIVSALVEAGQTAAPAFKTVAAAMQSLIGGAQRGTVTPGEIASTRALLDSLIEDFNLDIPE